LALILPFKGKIPRVAPDAYLAPTAVLIGDVEIGSQASVWFGAVLRGDNPQFGIRVGPRSNVQDNCVVHVGDWQPTEIGADVTIGHGAKFESCTIEDRCVVGVNAVILQEARIGEGSLVAANSVVLEGTQVPPRSLVAGVPGKVRKRLEGSSAEFVRRSANHYLEHCRDYRAQGYDVPGRCDTCDGPTIEHRSEVLCLSCGVGEGTPSADPPVE
jgi:carbonic anhydrase/acetyltransferase-like protein (isoleucine patch superfamily)